MLVFKRQLLVINELLSYLIKSISTRYLVDLEKSIYSSIEIVKNLDRPISYFLIKNIYSRFLFLENKALYNTHNYVQHLKFLFPHLKFLV